MKLLAESAIDDLRQALDGLAGPTTTGLWPAIEPLDRLQEAGMDVVIDFRASASLGAAVVVAKPRSPLGALLGPLSPRRRAVAKLLLLGASNKEIARTLGLSIGTVKDHVHDILRILGLRSRAALIAAALHQD